METIIGIGAAGCNIADKFASYNLYDVYKIDTGLEPRDPGDPNIEEGTYTYPVPKYETHEEYEKQAPDFKNFFSEIDSEILVVVCGAGNISGVTLKVLEQLVIQVKPENVNVLYIRPDIGELNGNTKLQERLGYNVLQQYARSGMFNNLILADNISLEKIVGDIPIREYFEKLNELLVSTLHMINIFNHSEVEINSFFKKSTASKISTLGLYDAEEDVEKLFFPLDKRLERHYYYAINEETLKSDGGLMQSIKNKMRDINQNGQRATYAVYSTQYATNYAYIISFSQDIQKDA